MSALQQQLITFNFGLDYRAREVAGPTVARLQTKPGVFMYVVIGTEYGFLHTSGGDVKTWGSYEGARQAALNYVAF